MIGGAFPAVLDAAQSGAEWAFSVLYRDLNPRLLRYFGAQAPADAEDLASETWMLAARGMHGFSGTEPAFRAWLFTIAHRRLIQHWRDGARRPPAVAATDALQERPGPSDVEGTVIRAEDAAAAARAISAALSSDQAEVVLLRVVAGLDVEQVAAILGKRSGTVRVVQHKALRRLASIFPLDALTL